MKEYGEIYSYEFDGLDFEENGIVPEDEAKITFADLFSITDEELRAMGILCDDDNYDDTF